MGRRASVSAQTTPTPLQTLILWSVLARGGEAAQKDVKPALTKPDRDALVGLRLLAQRTGPRRAVLVEVTDQGWAWAAEHLDAPLSASAAAAPILRALLVRLGVYLQSSGVALAEVIASQAPSPSVAAPIEAELGDRIRAAYLAETAGHFGRRARLCDLRARLREIPREALDAALLGLMRARAGVLMPLDDPTEITEHDRQAALQAGGPAWHLLLLER